MPVSQLLTTRYEFFGNVASTRISYSPQFRYGRHRQHTVLATDDIGFGRAMGAT